MSGPYEIDLSPKFKKRLRIFTRHHPQTVQKLPKLLKILQQNPGNPSLKTHRLKGDLKDYYAFSLDRSIRIVFCFSDEITILLVDIGTHDQVYR